MNPVATTHRGAVAVGVIMSFAIVGVSCDGKTGVPDNLIDGSSGEAPFQVRLEGSAAPFDVANDPRVEPLMLGAQGPAIEFELPIEVGETSVPDALIVPPPATVVRDPGLASVGLDQMIYAGRIPGTSVDLAVFPVDTPSGPQVGIYAFDGELVIVIATVSQAMAPGYGRSTVRPPEKEADIVFFGPLSREAAVVVLEAGGEFVGAVRPRARLAAFNTLEVAQSTTFRLVAYDATGGVIHEAVLATGGPPPTG